jgi:hypothetical protein
MSSVKSSQAAEESDVRHRQYLHTSLFVISAHRIHVAGNKHALGRKPLAKIMLRQLAEDSDNGFKPLRKQGARGALLD